MEENPGENQSSIDSKKKLLLLEEICGGISRILSPSQPVGGTAAGSESTAAVSPPNQQPADGTEIEMEDSPSESEPVKPAGGGGEIGIGSMGLDPVSRVVDSDAADSSQVDPKSLGTTTNTNDDVIMEETANEECKSDGVATETETEKPEATAGVVFLDD